MNDGFRFDSKMVSWRKWYFKIAIDIHLTKLREKSANSFEGCHLYIIY